MSTTKAGFSRVAGCMYCNYLIFTSTSSWPPGIAISGASYNSDAICTAQPRCMETDPLRQWEKRIRVWWFFVATHGESNFYGVCSPRRNVWFSSVLPASNEQFMDMLYIQWIPHSTCAATRSQTPCPAKSHGLWCRRASLRCLHSCGDNFKRVVWSRPDFPYGM